VNFLLIHFNKLKYNVTLTYQKEKTMKRIQATELNRKAGTILQKASQEPIIIEKSGHPIVVMLAYETYLELKEASLALAKKDQEKKASDEGKGIAIPRIWV